MERVDSPEGRVTGVYNLFGAGLKRIIARTMSGVEFTHRIYRLADKLRAGANNDAKCYFPLYGNNIFLKKTS